MKRALEIITSVFLSLTILMVSGGFTLSKMTCVSNGHQVLALSKQGECCNNNSSPVTKVKSKCCAIFNQNVFVDNFTSSFHKINFKNIQFAIGTFSIGHASFSSNKISAIKFKTIIHPPPVDAIDLLHYIHKLTV